MCVCGGGGGCVLEIIYCGNFKLCLWQIQNKFLEERGLKQINSKVLFQVRTKRFCIVFYESYPSTVSPLTLLCKSYITDVISWQFWQLSKTTIYRLNLNLCTSMQKKQNMEKFNAYKVCGGAGHTIESIFSCTLYRPNIIHKHLCNAFIVLSFGREIGKTICICMKGTRDNMMFSRWMVAILN